MKGILGLSVLLVVILSLSTNILEAQACKPSGKVRGVKPPPVSSNTKAVLTLNSFQEGGDGGGPCLKNITISGNGRSVVAMVVDECDSTMGSDKDHDYQPPCPNNIVDASKAVWKALGVTQ
ncbi:hypothetical protein IFM89_011964 [Coptis chinensis]|uniref:Uncharacterized protein n=1 Tax=Coptis chinensis TaxID=261450 RepID=A0A835LZY5_9MAGN|nr:hypothetical protein IFM89_011964 [Coptis chinensis]